MGYRFMIGCTLAVTAAALGQDGGARPPEHATVLVDDRTAGARKGTLVLVHGPFESGFHLHPGSELVVVVEGAFALEPAHGARVVLGAGDAAYLPPTAVHAWRKEGPGEMLAFYSPLGVEAPFQQIEPPSGTGKPQPPPVVVPFKGRTAYPVAGGKGTATLMLEGAVPASAGWLELREGAAVPEHVHAAEEEMLYVVAGSAEMTVRGKRSVLGAGSVVHIPANTPHSALVTSSQSLRAVQLYAPGGPEQRFKSPPR